MTYNQGAEIIRRKLAGGDITDDFPIKEEEVFFVMQQLAPLLIKRDFFETYNLEKALNDPTTYTTIIATLKTTDNKKEKYVVLPNAPLIILGNMIPQVSYIKDRFVDFNYIDVSQLKSYNDLGITNEMKGILYFYEYVEECEKEHRLVFLNIEDECIDKLKIRLVQNISFDSFDKDSTIPIKPELGYLLLDETYKWFVPQDMSNEDKVMDNRNNNVT